MSEQPRVVCLLSGGIDSATLANVLARSGSRVHALSFDYGQRNAPELKSARAVAESVGCVSHEVIDLSQLRTIYAGSASVLVGNDDEAMPHGHYADERMKTTIVPNRNMVLLAIAVAHAISIGAGTVAYAAHARVQPSTPDCRPAFIEALSRAVSLCDYEPPTLYAPFSALYKSDIVRFGVASDAPYALTWTCYESGARHCGRCATCVERLEAFDIAGCVDPAEYDDRTFWRSVAGRA